MRSLRALTLLGLGLAFATPAHATKQCFYSSGKAGALTVPMTAHSNDGSSYAETAFFALNGAAYAVTSADIDNSTPTGGVDLTAVSYTHLTLPTSDLV